VNDERRFSFLDNFALWAVLGASLYAMPFGSLLVPALSVEQAILAAAIAALIAGMLIASLAAIATNTGRSTAELMSEPFGKAGRWPVSLLLLGRHLLFTVFALTIIADAAELVSDRALGEGLRPAWVALFAAAGLALAMTGPGRVSTGLRRAGVWIVLLVALAVTASAYMEFEVPSYLRRPAVGGWPTMWQAIDIMLVFPLLWLPVVADFARRSKDARSAVRGTFLGIFLTTLWFGALGVVYLPAVDSSDIPGFVVGMRMSLGAIAILFILQADEVYANSYATIPAFESLGVGALSRSATALLVLIAVPAAVLTTVGDLEGYVLLTAAVFVPAAAIVISRAARPVPRPVAIPIVAWVGGFILYQWITPAPIEWWQDGLNSVFEALGLPFPLSDETDWLGAAIPAFLFAFVFDVIWVAGVREPLCEVCHNPPSGMHGRPGHCHGAR
jgi:purine-cytosine permease-like protein